MARMLIFRTTNYSCFLSFQMAQEACLCHCLETPRKLSFNTTIFFEHPDSTTTPWGGFALQGHWNASHQHCVYAYSCLKLHSKILNIYLLLISFSVFNKSESIKVSSERLVLQKEELRYSLKAFVHSYRPSKAALCCRLIQKISSPKSAFGTLIQYEKQNKPTKQTNGKDTHHHAH